MTVMDRLGYLPVYLLLKVGMTPGFPALGKNPLLLLELEAEPGGLDE